MSANAAICPKCGNQIIPYETIKPTFSNGFTSMVITTADNSMPFCVCSLKPVETEKHDGQLNGRNKSNVCPQCGGARNLYYKMEFIYKDDHTPRNLLAPVVVPFKICMCPPERVRHDGNLDEDGEYTVSHSHGAWGFEGIVLDEGKRTTAILRPSQALSLLAWLKQEESTLEQMVKEQQCTTN